MLLLLVTPVITTSKTTLLKSKSVGNNGGKNEASKLNFASTQLPLNARIKPAAAANKPKKKYSIALMARIWFLLAPMVLSRILSFIR